MADELSNASSTDRFLTNDEVKDQHYAYDSDDDNPHDRVPVTSQCANPSISFINENYDHMHGDPSCSHVYDYCRTSRVGCVRESATCATLSCP